MIKLKGYIFSRSFFDERVPQHIQNIILRDYCTKNNFQFLSSATEYAMTNSDLMLKQILNEFDYIDGIVAYSLFQLPKCKDSRIFIINKFLEAKKQIHFACESMSIVKVTDFEEIETLWQIKIATNTNSLI